MADAIDYATIRPALYKWVKAEAGGVAVAWSRDGGIRPVGAYIEISLHGPRKVGEPWRKTESSPDPELGDLRIRIGAHEMIRVQLQCIADPKSGVDAERVLANVLRGIELHVDELNDAGVGIGQMTEIGYAGEGSSGVFEPRAVASVWIHVGSLVERYVGSIDRVQITAHVKDAAGEDLDEHTDWYPIEHAFDSGFDAGFEI